jgi:hypothetical protein
LFDDAREKERPEAIHPLSDQISINQLDENGRASFRPRLHAAWTRRKRQSTVPITSPRPFSFSRLLAIGTNAQALPTLTVRFHGSTQRLGDAVGVGAEPGVIFLGPGEPGIPTPC